MNQEQSYSYLAVPAEAEKVQHDPHYIKHGAGDKHQRKIFELTEYDAYEKDKILELEQEAQKLNIKLPEGWTKSDTLKICYSGKFKLKDTVQKLQLNLSWRQDPQFHAINPKIQEFLEAGILYTFGRDKQYRPVVYLNAFVLDTKKHTKEFMIQALSFYLGLVRKYMLLPGKVENWILVIETNSVGVFGLPTSGMGEIIKCMALNFAGCLHKMIVLNPSFGLDLMWKAASAMMDDDAKAKNQFITKKTIEKLKEFIPVSNLEQKYGGQHPNLTKFWPPQLAEGQHV